MIPIPTPSVIPNAANIFLVSSVCRRWRDLAQRGVSTLLVDRKHAISRQLLSNAVARFPHLTHLHVCDGSVKTLDDAFLAHLASSCPKLTILHVGRAIAWHEGDDLLGQHEHAITQAGLDRFFQRCTQLEQLSLLCLHRDVELPPSFFHLTRLHTLALTAASALEPPNLGSLGALTTLHIASPELSEEQLANVRRLPSITNLSLSAQTTFSPRDPGLAAFMISELPLLKSLRTATCGSEFACLTALTTLCLGHVPLPSHIGRLRNLHTLLVTHSFWQWFFPPSLSHLSSLTSLVLHGCGVHELPEGVGQLTNLRHLHVLSCPHLNTLPPSLTRLTRLESLTLSDCESLALAPTRWDGLTRPKRLEVAGCHILKRPHHVLPPSLETLIWGGNAHRVPLPHVSTLTGLRSLCLARVAVACGAGVSRSLPHMEHLALHLPDDAEELPFALAHRSRLHSLAIHGGRRLQRLLAHIGSALPQLRTLMLKSVGELRELPASVSALHHLTSLTVDSAPKLASLPHGIAALSSLQELQLISCKQLEHVPVSLSHLTRLH
ncbi:unnamed protein product [Closterium sp. Naga37s-1]|nr:unnamed protein product [Closterium sp. Naga37s-1]